MAEKFCAIIETDALGDFHPEKHAELRRGMIHLTVSSEMGRTTGLHLQLYTGTESASATIELRDNAWVIYAHDEDGHGSGVVKLFAGGGSEFEP